MLIRDFYQKHKGQTAILVGLGPNLKLTPPKWFDYPSFSMNTIFKHPTWQPDYYVGVDVRLMEECAEIVNTKFSHIPKFIPSPRLDAWPDAPNLVRFLCRMGDLYVGGQLPNQPEAMTKFGLSWQNVMAATMQIAWFMGFSRLLLIGVQHQPDNKREHFWGVDHGMPESQELEIWLQNYADVVRMMGSSCQVLNISEDTHVPENILPRGDWREWKNSDDNHPARKANK